MIEARTEYNKLFQIFCMKEPDYVMKIMAIWVALDELQGERKVIYFIYRSVTKDTNQFTYRNPFGVHFRYIRQVENHNNRINAPISLEYSVLVVTFPGIFPCRKLIQLSCQVTFKIMCQCNQFWIFGELWKQRAFKIQLGFNWRIMDNLR